MFGTYLEKLTMDFSKSDEIFDFSSDTSDVKPRHVMHVRHGADLSRGSYSSNSHLMRPQMSVSVLSYRGTLSVQKSTDSPGNLSPLSSLKETLRIMKDNFEFDKRIHTGVTSGNQISTNLLNETSKPGRFVRKSSVAREKVLKTEVPTKIETVVTSTMRLSALKIVLHVFQNIPKSVDVLQIHYGGETFGSWLVLVLIMCAVDKSDDLKIASTRSLLVLHFVLLLDLIF